MYMFNGLSAARLALLALILSACTAEKPAIATSAPCDFQVAEHTTPKLATYADDLHIPYQQDKLVEFMWADESECYARQFAPMNIYRIPYTIDNGVFPKLREAPAKEIASWKAFEAASGNMLMGLTTFRFESGAKERIIESTILLRADAANWHLWHEFSHFIIGTDRAAHHDHSLRIADQITLENLKTAAVAFSADEANYSQKLQAYLNANHEFLVKRYLDEIVIEATLIFLVQQQGATPGATNEDVQNSLHLIQFFQTMLNQHVDVTTNTIEGIRQNSLTPAQIDLLNMYQQRLKDQRDTAERIIIESTKLSRNALLSL